METTGILVLKSAKGFTCTENLSDIDAIDVIDSILDSDLDEYVNKKSIPIIRVKLKNGRTFYYEALAWTMSFEHREINPTATKYFISNEGTTIDL